MPEHTRFRRSVARLRQARSEIINQLTQKKVNIVTQTGEKVNLLLGKEQGLGELLRTKGISLDQIKDLNMTEGTLEEAFVKVLNT